MVVLLVISPLNQPQHECPQQKRDMGVAQKSTAGVTRVVVIVSIHQGAILWIPFFEQLHSTPASIGVVQLSPTCVKF